MTRVINMPQLMAERSLSTSEKLFYIYLALNLCDERGRCQLPIRELHERTHLSNGKLNESIPKLVRAGYIWAKLQPGFTGRQSWLLTLTDYGLLKEEEQPAPMPAPITLPAPATLEAGPVRITITFEPREETNQS